MDSLRLLTESDAAAYRELRRRALQDHPEAYSATLEEFEQRTLDEIAATLRMPISQRCTFGVFADDRRLASPLLSPHQLQATPPWRCLPGLCRAGGAELAPRASPDAGCDRPRCQQVGLKELRIGVTVGNGVAPARLSGAWLHAALCRAGDDQAG